MPAVQRVVLLYQGVQYWTVVITDRAGNQLGELRNATSRSLRLPLNRTPTFTFQIDATHQFAPVFLDDDKVLIKVYGETTTGRTLRFYGPIIGHQKTRNAQGGTISVTAAGVQWRLDHRLIGKNQAGTTFGTTALSLLDRGEMMGRIIDALNTGEATNVFADAADTGIRRGAITPGSQTYAGPWRYKPAGEAISDLAGTLDGPDWQVRPVEPTTDSIGVQIGALDVAPVIGTVKPNVAFEFGTGQHNVAEWQDVGDSSGLANRVVNLPPGYPDNATQQPIQWDDTAAITDRGLHETVVSADLQTDDLRTKLVQNHVRVRKVPRRVVAFTPVAEDSSAPVEERRVPRLFDEYVVGDIVRFRAVERFPVFDTAGTVIGTSEVPMVDLLMRVFVAQLDIDDNGTASTSLGLQSDS